MTYTWLSLPRKKFIVVNLTLHSLVATCESRSTAQKLADMLNKGDR